MQLGLTYVVVHKCDVVRRGLAEILRTNSDNHVIDLARIDDLLLFPLIQDNVLVIVSQSLFETNRQFVLEMLNACVGKEFLWLDDAFDSCRNDNSICLSDSCAMILHKVEKLKRKFDDNKPDDCTVELSKREKDVLRLVALGHTNKEIAEELFLSIHTVISHRKNIVDKTGIKTTPGLTMYALLKRVVDMSEFDAKQLT